MQKRFLYGASVQGIQSFIFQTNKLKEIVGASELVDKICTEFFQDSCKCDPIETNLNWIIGAAGNIKYLFSSEEEVKSVVLDFPKKVMLMAPGITLSQAGVEVEGDLSVGHISELEGLLKLQRNRMVDPFYYGYMATERSRRTGVVSWSSSSDYEDLPSILKKEHNGKGLLEKIGHSHLERQFVFDIERFVSNEKKSWIAVVHADGNSLGVVIQKLSAVLKGKVGSEIVEKYRSFSQNLDMVTRAAAKEAFSEIFSDEIKNGTEIGFRPIVIGGDDLTVIIQASKAVPFTQLFLAKFEKLSSEVFKGFFKSIGLEKECLTTCAGISFVKSSFPFHYAVSLAENLCKKAKTASKNTDRVNPPSSLAFFKVQSSFVDDLDEMIKKELVCKSDSLSFFYGPYFLNQEPSIAQLSKKVEKLREEKAPSSQLRQWLTERYHDKGAADMLIDRTIEILRRKKQGYFIKDLDLESLKDSNNKVCPVYDWITLNSLQ